MNKNKILFYSHLPKTAGTSMKHSLLKNYTLGEDFFHLAINGILDVIRTRGECVYETIENLNELKDGTILFGHRVDESFWSQINTDTEVIMSTMLRHPFQRMVSAYYMKRNSDNFTQSFDEFYRSRPNLICKFYVSRFPSLISNAFDSLLNQSKEVLDHFNLVEVLEHPGSVQNIMSQFGLKEEKIVRINVSTSRSIPKTLTLENIDFNIFTGMDSDLMLYEHYRKKNTNKHLSIAKKPIKPRIWLYKYLKLINIKQEYKTEIINSIKTPELKKLAIISGGEKQNNSFNLIEKIIDTYPDAIGQSNLAHNIFDVLQSNFNQCRPQLQSYNNKDSFYSKILYELINYGKIKDKGIIDKLPNNLRSSMIHKINFLIDQKKFDEAKEELNHACRHFPDKTWPFKKLHNLAKLTGDKNIMEKSMFKIQDLDPYNFNN